MDFRVARERVEQYIQELVKDVPYALGDAVRHACKNPGKLTRPLITLAVASDLGVGLERALHYAVAMQLAHEASLVFDDKMDGSDTRRGLPSVYRKFGEHTATLAGLYLLKLGQRSIVTGCTDDKDKRRLTYLDACTGLELCVGQWLDLNSENVKAEDLERFYHLKTGILMGVAAEAGGILGRASENDLKKLRQGMSYVGVAYQVGDDLADVLGTAEELGKPVNQDREKRNAISLWGIDKSREEKRRFDATADTILGGLKKPLPSLRIIINEIRAKHEKYLVS